MSQPAAGIISRDFVTLIEKVSNVVHKISGNRLGEKQAYMVETRVKKRMMELGVKTAQEYSVYIDKNLEHESYILVGLITTHHTFFFREFPHFEILKNKLPDLIAAVKKRNDKMISVWSAAFEKDARIEQKLNSLKLETMEAEAMIKRMVESGRMNNQEASRARREIASAKEDDKIIIKNEASEKFISFKTFATK